jgi:predicted amidohydrolase YtcJ
MVVVTIKGDGVMSIFKNGNILTLEKEVIAEAFIVRGGYFFAVGSNDEMSNLAEAQEEVIDLMNKTVVPGFCDGHMHFLNYATTKDRVDISRVKSIEGLIAKTKVYIKEKNIAKNEWIISRGWNDNYFEEKRLITRYDLDKISNEHPIIFTRVCGHVATVNSKALEILKITKHTENPAGGIIDKVNGEPTGVLRENALNIALNYFPIMKKEEIKGVLNEAFKDAVKVGLTTIHTDDLGQAASLENLLAAYRELEMENSLPLRVTLQVFSPTVESIKLATSLGLKTGVGSDLLKVGPIKIYQDGSLGGRTAAMEEEYSDTPTKGVIIYSQKQLNELTLEAHKAGFQIAIHCIGDRAMNMILNSYENLQEECGEGDYRHTLIHCQFTDDSILEKFKKLKVVANVQPSFVMTDYPIVEKAVGRARSEKSYAWKDILKGGIPLAFSSDAPIESFNPILGIYAAVTRKDLQGSPKGGWHKDQSLTVWEALRAFTQGTSYMNFEENIKGSISKGKLGDFIVLSEDITKCETDNIKNIKVLETYMGGKKVYSINN